MKNTTCFMRNIKAHLIKGVLFFITVSIVFALIIYQIALHQGEIYSAIGFSLTALYPSFFMFLRISIYKNENSRKLLTEDENGNKITEQVIGYHPVIYYIFGSLLSCYLIGFSLMKVGKTRNIWYHAHEPHISDANILCFIIEMDMKKTAN